jgi:hypothetical protein
MKDNETKNTPKGPAVTLPPKVAPPAIVPPAPPAVAIPAPLVTPPPIPAAPVVNEAPALPPAPAASPVVTLGLLTMLAASPGGLSLEPPPADGYIASRSTRKDASANYNTKTGSGHKPFSHLLVFADGSGFGFLNAAEAFDADGMVDIGGAEVLFKTFRALLQRWGAKATDVPDAPPYVVTVPELYKATTGLEFPGEEAGAKAINDAEAAVHQAIHRLKRAGLVPPKGATGPGGVVAGARGIGALVSIRAGYYLHPDCKVYLIPRPKGYQGKSTKVKNGGPALPAGWKVADAKEAPAAPEAEPVQETTNEGAPGAA